MNFKSILEFTDIEIEKKFLGPNNQNLSLLADEMHAYLNHVSGFITIDEENNSLVNQYILTTIKELYENGNDIEARDLIHIVMLFNESNNLDLTKEQILNFYKNKKVILNTFESKKIIAKTLVQKKYIEAIDSSSIVFVTGSAGTGKTYLAVAYAVNLLKKNKIKKLIITRPAVEAGEKLGFLPGDLKEKVDPYLIPIYDALNDFLGKENVDRMIEKGIIEIAPLAYMRGRTLDNAFIILDEAQNTTQNQMKMFVTRLGFNSKMIITGDITQIDLPINAKSGLVESTNILRGIKGIEHIHFTKHDVMRHPIVSKIIERYEENYDKN